MLGLSRSEAGAASLRSAGAEPLFGTIEQLDLLRDAAAKADGVIHLAFNHDFSKFADNCEADRRAIETLGAALEGSDRPLLVTSGVALLAPGRVAVEADAPPAVSEHYPRSSEAAAEAAAARGVRASAVRLAPSVHGHGDHGFIPLLIGLAREKSVSAYIGEGTNRWPGVHRDDAARLYRLALERGTGSERYHAIAEEGVPFKDIAAVIGRRLNVPVIGMPPAEAAAHFTWFTRFAAMDAPTSAQRTRTLLDWAPSGPGLLEDLDHPAYFGG